MKVETEAMSTRNRIELQNSGGFTLIEVMTALTILAIMATITFSVVLNSSMRSRALDREMELKMAANSIVNLIVEDLKGAFIRQGVVPYFIGEDSFHREDPNDAVSLITTSTLPINPQAVGGDLAEVGYRLSFDEEEGKGGVLYRREESPVRAPFEEGGGSYEISGKVRSLNLRYYDGEDWMDDWDSQDMSREHMVNKLPREIEIEITLEDESSQVVIRTRVAPPMAVEQ